MRTTLTKKLPVPLLLLVLLTGCAVGPDFKQPETEIPASYRAQEISPETHADLQWWTLFDDLQLYALVTAALENNRDLKVAVSRISQARANVGFTRADQFPRLDIKGGVNTGNFNGGSLSKDTNTTLYLSAPLRWEIDFWGKLSRSTEAAQAEMFASEFGLKSIQLALIADVVTNYYQLLDFHQRLNIAAATLDSRLGSLEIIQQRFDMGVIAELDVNQAQIQKEIAAAAIPFYQRSIAKAENNLSILLGRLPQGITLGDAISERSVPPQIPVGLPSEILERRPDIAQSLYLLKAQTERIGVAQALRLPSISLTGVLGVASSELGGITTDGGGWSVGGGLLGPLIDFNKNKNRVLIEEQKTKQALYQYENQVLNAFREVEDALVEISTYKQELAAITRQRRAAKNANELSKQRYDKGVSSYLEVLDTERTLFSAELQRSDLQRQYRSAYVNLYRALGGGWVTEAEAEGEGEGNN